jgi:serine/threonine-protein kinase HipA
LTVHYDGRLVGTLAETGEGAVAFEYSARWLADGFSISPFSLPLQPGVFLPGYQPFEGLFGVFSDSLPDGWGRFVLDRMLRQRGVDPDTLSQLQRLAIVGASGMGALTYEPEVVIATRAESLDLDALAAQCKLLIDTRTSADIDELFRLGGSSGGARPKVLMQVDGADWIIKFPASMDQSDIGLMEYEYAQAACDCGIDLPEYRLFSSRLTPGYFGVKRFDRAPAPAQGKARRLHMLSASALLETSHRIPALDYRSLAAASLRLSSDYAEAAKLYRLMCFNVCAHNHDDHSRNFSFLYDEASAAYRLSPAYDLTYSSGMGGELATTVGGKGKDIQEGDLLAAGRDFGLKDKDCRHILDKVKAIASPLSQKWGARNGA